MSARRPGRGLLPVGGLVAVLPWTIAALAVAFAVAGRPGSGSAPAAAPRGLEAPGTEWLSRRLLERDLALAERENEALRRELDRLVERLAPRSSRSAEDGAEAETGGPGGDGPSEVELRAIADGLVPILERVVEGDAAAEPAAAVGLLRLASRGPAAFEWLQAAYRSARDPGVQALLARAIVLAPGERASAFLEEELARERDPALRAVLVRQLARVATPASAAATTAALVPAVDDATLDVRARVETVRALRFAAGPEIDEALRAASYDPSDDVRLAAAGVMAGSPHLLGELRDLWTGDPSPRVRRVARCRALLASESF